MTTSPVDLIKQRQREWARRTGTTVYEGGTIAASITSTLDYGDGTDHMVTSSGTGNVIASSVASEHVYVRPGRFTAVFTARTAEGTTASAVTLVSVE